MLVPYDILIVLQYNLAVSPSWHLGVRLPLQLGRHRSGLIDLQGSSWIGTLLGGNLNPQLFSSTGQLADVHFQSDHDELPKLANFSRPITPCLC